VVIMKQGHLIQVCSTHLVNNESCVFGILCLCHYAVAWHNRQYLCCHVNELLYLIVCKNNLVFICAVHQLSSALLFFLLFMKGAIRTIK
jgi:hypothetical protein